MKKPVLNIAPGQTVNYHGEPCLVLEHRKDGTMLLHLDQMTHAFGSSNNFAASSCGPTSTAPTWPASRTATRMKSSPAPWTSPPSTAPRSTAPVSARWPR